MESVGDEAVVWRRKSSEVLRRAISWKLMDDSEVFTTSIIRAIIVVLVAVRTWTIPLLSYFKLQKYVEYVIMVK
jgi:hypothetical protein